MRISVTGHRPNKLGGYSDEAFYKLVNLFYDFLSRNQEVDTVISGMALGWDQAVVVASLSAKRKVIAAVPCLNQESKWPLHSRVRYKELISKCDEVVYVSNQPYFPSCMQERNEWMVDNSELVVALYNGDLSGGTFNCIQYAKKQNKPINNRWNEYIKQ